MSSVSSFLSPFPPYQRPAVTSSFYEDYKLLIQTMTLRTVQNFTYSKKSMFYHDRCSLWLLLFLFVALIPWCDSVPFSGPVFWAFNSLFVSWNPNFAVSALSFQEVPKPIALLIIAFIVLLSLVVHFTLFHPNFPLGERGTFSSPARALSRATYT